MKRIGQWGRRALLLGALLGLASAAQAADYTVGQRLKQAGKGDQQGVKTITWDDLIPTDWQPERFIEQLKLDQVQDGDPRANEALNRIRAEWDKAPVVGAMNGQRVRLPGFIVPLDADQKSISEFLLVPYFGACVHVPPPPQNQLILVKPAKAVSAKLNMEAVWVTGLLQVDRTDTAMGNAGYRLQAEKVERYTDPLPR